MRLDELTQREDFWGIFVATMRQAWGEMLGSPVDISIGPHGEGQLWRVHPVLSAFFSEAPSSAVRRHMRDSFRFTSVAWRMVPQLVLGTGLATSTVLRISSRPAFRVRPSIENAGEMLIVPGNRRVRLFDFTSRVSRVHMKCGFDHDAIRAEVAIRGDGRTGPFLPIMRYAADHSWFEEAIFDGYALARCPPWLPREQIASRALSALEAWSGAATVSYLSSEEIINALLGSLSENTAATQHLQLRTDLAALAASLAESAQRLGEVERVPSHGDFQPGNVLIDRRGTQIAIVDWEFSATRAKHYDRLVFGLASRAPLGLASRMVRFVQGDGAPSLAALPKRRGWRIARCALFALEELEWRLSSCINAPFRAAPPGLVQALSELSTFADHCRRSTWR
jgi:hypothetical protein